MLPIFRILPVGGVLLAILILALALSPPDGTRPPLNTTIAPARGALVAREYHPEMRQFLIMAALKRADELNRLRDLPDTPTRTGPTEPETVTQEPKVADLPSDPAEFDPSENDTGVQAPGMNVPAEAGLQAIDSPPATDETTSAVEKPEQLKPQPHRDIRRRAHRPRHARPSANQRPLTLFDALFGGPQRQYRSPAYGPAQSAQAYQQPTYGLQQPGQNQYQEPLGGGQQSTQQEPIELYPMLRQQYY